MTELFICEMFIFIIRMITKTQLFSPIKAKMKFQDRTSNLAFGVKKLTLRRIYKGSCRHIGLLE